MAATFIDISGATFGGGARMGSCTARFGTCGSSHTRGLSPATYTQQKNPLVERVSLLAGVLGFEPRSADTKNRCVRPLRHTPIVHLRPEPLSAQKIVEANLRGKPTLQVFSRYLLPRPTSRHARFSGCLRQILPHPRFRTNQSMLPPTLTFVPVVLRMCSEAP